MTDKQILAGLIAQSMLFSIGAFSRGEVPRAKINRALKSKLIKKREHDFDKFQDLVIKANNIYKASWEEFETGLSINVPKFLWQFNEVAKDLLKPYKLNQKYLDKLVLVTGEDNLSFNTRKALNSLMKGINEAPVN